MRSPTCVGGQTWGSVAAKCEGGIGEYTMINFVCLGKTLLVDVKTRKNFVPVLARHA